MRSIQHEKAVENFKGPQDEHPVARCLQNDRILEKLAKKILKEPEIVQRLKSSEKKLASIQTLVKLVVAQLGSILPSRSSP